MCITGLETAQKNANDGISLVQTAEGALTEVHSMLNRMVELADQSANGTYDDATDRENLQKEVTSLKDEINRISEGTNFNGINLLQYSAKQTNGGADVATTVGAVTAGKDGAFTINGATVAAEVAENNFITIDGTKYQILTKGKTAETGAKALYIDQTAGALSADSTVQIVSQLKD